VCSDAYPGGAQLNCANSALRSDPCAVSIPLRRVAPIGRSRRGPWISRSYGNLSPVSRRRQPTTHGNRVTIILSDRCPLPLTHKPGARTDNRYELPTHPTQPVTSTKVRFSLACFPPTRAPRTVEMQRLYTFLPGILCGAAHFMWNRSATLLAVRRPFDSKVARRGQPLLLV
jgi:hypothetical protein